MRALGKLNKLAKAAPGYCRIRPFWLFPEMP
jgi:hypothetical protein